MCAPITSIFVCLQVKQRLFFKWRPKWFICSCFHTCPPLSLFLCLSSSFSALSSRQSWMTSWTTCRMLSRSSSASRDPSRCPVPWTNRTSSMTSCRCLRRILPWQHSSTTGASGLAWAQRVSPTLTGAEKHYIKHSTCVRSFNWWNCYLLIFPLLHTWLKPTRSCLQTSEVSDQASQAGVCLWGVCLWTWMCHPSSHRYSTP